MEIFISICLLLCGVGVFLAGMHLMGMGLEKSTSKSIQALFGKINNNSLASYGLGVGATAIIQSSSATSVMSMGLVGAGIMSVPQASAFVLGAKLGTTITGILVSLSSFKITPLLMTLAFFGICVVLFVKNESAVSIGYIFAGLGILFAGMDIMSNAISNHQEISVFFVNMFKAIDFPLLLILVGTVFTAIIQSSSATSGILITLISAGTLTVSQAIFISIGASIGTCITGILAGIGSNGNARKVAVFNVITAIIGAFTVGMGVWIFKKPITKGLAFLIPAPQWQLSVFAVIYSLIASLICLPFIKHILKFVSLFVGKAPKESDVRCFFINEQSLNTPQIALIQAKREVENLSFLAMENLRYGYECFINQDDSKQKRIEREEERIDFITKRISEFLVKLAGKDLPYQDELLIGTLHHVIDDIERIGDHAVGFMKVGIKMKQEELVFSKTATTSLNEMYETVKREYDVAVNIFKDNNSRLLPEIDNIEKTLDSMKKTLSLNHVYRIAEGTCKHESAALFYSAIDNLERIGDHLENLAYSIRSITGDTAK